MTALTPDFGRPHPLSHALVGVAVAAGAALALALLSEERWLPGALMVAATIGAALTPVLRLPGSLIAVLALASVINGASIAWDWYTAWAPFDEWAHLLNPALLVAPSMIWLHRAGIWGLRAESPTFVVAATLYGLGLAVGWEVIEVFFWTFPVSDTVSDVVLGVLGSIAGGWWAARLILQEQRAPSP